MVAAGVLVACGSARKVADDRPLCERCHGGTSGNAAPPSSVSGAIATADPKVGAHQAHVVAGRLRGPIACGECHVVPADMAAHEVGIAAIAKGTASRVTFGPLADRHGAGAAWDPATGTCVNLYCHGATIAHGGANHEPPWTAVDAPHSQATCSTASCHGSPPPLPHPANSNCGDCHSATTTDGATINIAGGTSTHIDGHLTIDLDACAGDCTCCHGAPPATGAHFAHVTSVPTAYGQDTMTADSQPSGATAYDFGCGNCHSVDPADHATGLVVLTQAGATAGGLKSKNPLTAAYDAVTGRCSDVYCHSSGQESPAFATSPAWLSGAPLGCGGCHGNPPSYASGGAGATAANSHLGLLAEGDGLTYETGHFAGFPAMVHDGSQHGGSATADSSPITCQSCHFDTTDPANVGPSAFYYLDTSGSYDLGGTGSFTLGGTTVGAYSCTACHDGTPPAGTGSVKPFFHVNGTRDVAFDTRTSLPGATAGLPAAPNTPTRPYWFTSAPAWVATSVGASGGMDGTTVSFHIASATWDSGAKSCSGVACHFNRTTVTWGEPLDYSGVPTGTCSVCHNR
jgi:predicted CxxxxCH...CXXCH cytochrome family protein